PEAREVERHHLDGVVPAAVPNLLECRPPAVLVAGGDDDPSPEAGQPDRGLLADPGVPTRDHNDLADHVSDSASHGSPRYRDANPAGPPTANERGIIAVCDGRTGESRRVPADRELRRRR